MGLNKLRFITITVLVFFLSLGSLFFVQHSSATGGGGNDHGKKNDQIHVHLKGNTDLVSGITVIYKGDPLQLKAKSSKLYSIKQPGDIVEPDITKIIVTLKDGTQQVFSPASDYAGVEGKGTINYWLTISDSEEDQTGGKDQAENNETGGNLNEDNNSGTNTNDQDASPGETHDENTQTAVTETVNGGKLPQTATPWYTLIFIGSLLAIGSGFAVWKIEKGHIGSNERVPRD